MIIYNPNNEQLINERLKYAEQLLQQIPAKYAFITGSFLFKEKFNDIDIFVISRTKKEIVINDKKAKITLIDFNDLYSIFYHSITKSCIAKNILPNKPLKVTLSDYWQVVNEAIPTLLNHKDKFHKNIRFLILYTEYFRTNEILDTFKLNQMISSFRDYKEIINYIKAELPKIIVKQAKPSYIKRFFYTQAGYYRNSEYKAQSFLYELVHAITRASVNG